MDQDKLNHVLTAKPHERRIFIEEAAGIARYKQQRNETQGKLDAARQNLVRVRDVMDEVRRQLGSLERQARKAQQYKALQGERRELALALLAADYAGLTAEAEALSQEVTRCTTPSRAARSRRPARRARGHASARRIQASEHRLGDLRQSVQKVQGELERLLERREQMGVPAPRAGRGGRAARRGGPRRPRERLGRDRRRARDRARGARRTRDARSPTGAARGAGAGGSRSSATAPRCAERDRLEALRLEQMRVAAERTDLMREAGELRERQAQLARRA